MCSMSIEVSGPKVSKGLLFIIQLIELMDSHLGLGGCIGITGIKTQQLLLGVTVKDHDHAVDLLHEPGSIGW